MGRIQKGILGGFSGKVGTVVGATWRGIEIMRSRPKRSSRPPTDQQAEQRERFAFVAHFLRPVRSLLRMYFGQPSGAKSRSNLATSYHMTETVTGTYPNFAIDYPKVIVSKGELLGLQDATVSTIGGGEIKCNWTDNTGQGQAVATDAVFVAVYNESKQLWETKRAIATRVDSVFNLNLADTWVGDTVHCWVGVVKADDKLCSNSEYFGPVVLT